MVNADKREIAAQVLQRFLDGSITNDEFEDEFPRDQRDPVLVTIRHCVWGHYSDLSRHKLTGKYAPTPEAKALLERCLLFLKSNLEFEWPVPGLGFFMGLLSIFTLGWVARRREKKYARLGDYDVWPFLRRRDYEIHATTSALPSP